MSNFAKKILFECMCRKSILKIFIEEMESFSREPPFCTEIKKELKQERIHAIVREISISGSTKRDCISIFAG